MPSIISARAKSRAGWLCLAIGILALTADGGEADKPQRCAVCNQPLAGSYTIVTLAGKQTVLCPKCAAELKRRLDEDAPVCAICGAKIKGSYTQVQRGGQKLTICNACMDSPNKCRRCRLPIKTGEFCDFCEKEAPRCSLCHRIIVGEFHSYPDGEKFCRECMANAPRCARCRRPLAEKQKVERAGTLLCEKCAGETPICHCCGKAILGVYFRHPFAEGEFCKDCEEQRPKCSACGRPIPDEPAPRANTKRPVCGECLPTVVETRARFLAIYDDCRRILLDLLQECVVHELKVMAVEDIAAVRKTAGLESDNRELGLFQRTGDDYRIYVLNGITEALAYETLSHEWAHAWCAEQAHPDHAQWVEEGFCQWVAAQVLGEKGFSKGLKILVSRDDLYGQGYRHIAEIAARQGGVAGALRYMNNPPPPGAPRKER